MVFPALLPEEVGKFEIYFNNGSIAKVTVPPEVQQAKAELDGAMKSNVVQRQGGIDFQPDKMHLDVRGNGGGIKLHADRTMAAPNGQLQEVLGLTPELVSIQPLENLRVFLEGAVQPQMLMIISYCANIFWLKNRKLVDKLD